MITVRVTTFLKPGVLDAQGQAVQQGLATMGHPVEGVRVGRAFEVTLREEGWEEELRLMCRRYLTNPLIEEYTWEVVGRPEATGA
jgi:phosphoribosylformylglycinamidine synthase